MVMEVIVIVVIVIVQPIIIVIGILVLIQNHYNRNSGYSNGTNNTSINYEEAVLSCHDAQHRRRESCC